MEPLPTPETPVHTSKLTTWHLAKQQRCGTEELKFVPFMAVKEKSPYVRKFLEKLLISKHSFVESDLGMNKNH